MITVTNRTSFLIEAAKLLPKESTCVELGAEKGLFSKEILTYLEPGQLFLVDPWQVGHDKNSNITHYTGLWFITTQGEVQTNNGPLPTAYSNEEFLLQIKETYSKEIENGKIIVKKAFSYEAVSTFPDDFFDFIYIDACHLYDCVKSDLNSYLPKLKKTGLMCGHDYIKCSNFGVIEAVDEFVKNNNFKWTIKNDNGGDWALSRRQSVHY
jgi:hypothetical protein